MLSVVVFMKRAMDVVLSLLALLILVPLIICVAALVWWCLGRPVLFRQQRPGLYGVPFCLVKFRTMLERDDDGKRFNDAERMTRFGYLLRATSLDELPELWNVLRGEMSIVGPRPLLMDYLPLYTSEQMRRHDVRPGITGWAQVNGRNAITWEEKFQLDIWYVENHSFVTDLRVIWMTLGKLISREGISEDGQITMAQFKGGVSRRPTRR